ncbi:hypothetical protein LTR53_006423 [Teratosphaeriaceae sp. CCFEE 6253]|nr:hypothetical protein LTR53_006423 [Teratosphaeriaceae sp. CCFEE 6253]
MSSGTVGWREAGRASQSTQAPSIPAPTAINPASHSAILGDHGHGRRQWSLERRPPASPSLMTELHAEPTNLHPSYERHTPTPGGNYGPPQLESASPRYSSQGAWRSLHQEDRRATSTMTADAPLTLHIPPSQGCRAHRPRLHRLQPSMLLPSFCLLTGDGMEDLPRISPVYIAVKPEAQLYRHGYQTPSQTVPSLPSFASFEEQASRPDEAEVDGPEIAPMAARLSCYLCSKLEPIVRDVAIAAAELDENVQSHCNKAVTRRLDLPASDSPVRTAQWILDRLRYAKQDMVDAALRAQQPAYFFPHPPAPTGSLSRPGSPGSSAKRQMGWGKDDYPLSKRQRSGHSPDFNTAQGIYDRRASIDFTSRSVYSPQPSESAPLSAYPRTASPSLLGRPLRPLPSPSSLAYPHSAAASLPPPTVHPGSPALSYQASASIHTTSANSVTSAHIADLQHQVTLKSLSLQTLQSEYSSLLQKFQRERVKSQTIEKKTTVSEQEVNDLTGRNEELTELVKGLESQLEDSERKRDGERADATKEKEQWGRMLDMSGRLQAKLAVERQRLVEERDQLKRRAVGVRIDQEGSRSDSAGSTTSNARSLPEGDARRGSPHAAVRGNTPSRVDGFNNELEVLRARVNVLTSTLQQVRRQNLELGDRSRSTVQTSGEMAQIINRALGADESGSPKRGIAIPDPGTLAVPTIAKASPHPSAPPIVVSTTSTTSPPKLAPLIQPPSSSARPALPTPTSATGPSIAEMARAGRAVSPGPEELGIHIQPSTSSPEELIHALGPVPAPAPLPAFQFQPGGAPYAPTYSQARRHSYSPPEVRQGYAPASPYRHLQSRSPYTDPPPRARMGRPRPSPPSDNSSPDSLRGRESPPHGGATQQQQPAVESSGAVTFERRPHQQQDLRLAPPSSSRVMHMEPQRKFPFQTPDTPTTGLAGFRQWGNEPRQGSAATAMPPPPRPLLGSQAAPPSQTSGV